MKAIGRFMAIFFAAGLLGCSPTQSPENQSANGQSESDIKLQADRTLANDSLEAISALPNAAPTIKVATDISHSPYGLKDERGQVTGFDLALLRAIGENQGFKVEIYNDDRDELLAHLSEHRYDMLAAGLTYREALASDYLLSDTYLPLPTTLVYLNDDLTITSYNDLFGLRLGILSEGAANNFFSQNNFGLTSITPYPSLYLALQAMAQGKIDAVAGDSGVLRYLLSDLPELTPKYFDYGNLSDPEAKKVFVVRVDQPELIEKLNLGLANLQQSGVYGELTRQWFGQDLTPAALEQKATAQ